VVATRTTTPAERDGPPLTTARRLHGTAAAVALLVLRRVHAVFWDGARVASVGGVLLGFGSCVDAVKGAVLAAGVGAVGPGAGGVGAVGLARVDGVVALVVAVLLVVHAVAVVVAAARVVAHVVALWAFGVGVGAAVAVVAAGHGGALRVAIGFVA